MKQSKTPLWKKSCLSSLSYWEIIEYLEEIGENGDPYGYEDDSINGYYNDYKEQFDELSMGAYEMHEKLMKNEYVDGYEKISDVWDDMTVNLLGDLYSVLGYDTVELDYFKLEAYEEDCAMREAEKRLMRLTKKDLIKNFRKVLMTLVMFFDIKASHDCLISIVETLDERGALLEQKNKRINRIYEDLTGRNGELFDEELKNIPPRMWVE